MSPNSCKGQLCAEPVSGKAGLARGIREHKGARLSEPEGLVVGIDVAKTALDVAVHPAGEERQLTNDAAGHAPGVGGLQGVRPWLILVLGEGGYWKPLVAPTGTAHPPIAAGKSPPGTDL